MRNFPATGFASSSGPDRAGDVLDTGALWLDLAYAAREDERIIEITQGPERYRPLLDSLACHPSASGRQPAGET